MTAAASRHHIIILLQHDVLIVIKVQQVNAEEFIRYTAGGLDALGQFEGVDDGLNCGVVGRPHVLTQGKRTGAFAVVGIVAARRHNPPRPADLLKVDVERQTLTRHLLSAVIIVCRASAAMSRCGERKAGKRETGSSGRII